MRRDRRAGVTGRDRVGRGGGLRLWAVDGALLGWRLLGCLPRSMLRSVTASARTGRGALIKADGKVVRWVSVDGRGWSGIAWSELDEADADNVIAEQVAYFGGRCEKFEWKLYDYDRPSDLARRLLAAGFTAEGEESLMCADVAAVAAELPPGVRLLPVADEAGVGLLIGVHERVFGTDHSRLRRSLLGQLRGSPEVTAMVVAMAGDEPVCSARIPQAQPEPRPAHEIGIWLGVTGPCAVRLAGAKADGWSVSAPYLPLEQLRSLNNILTASAEEAGRDPERIVCLYNVMGLITPDGRDMFNGPVGRWVDTLTTLDSEYQMNTFIFWPSGDRERQSRIFAEEVVPPAPGAHQCNWLARRQLGKFIMSGRCVCSRLPRRLRNMPGAAEAGGHAQRCRCKTYGLDACLLAVAGVANGAENS